MRPVSRWTPLFCLGLISGLLPACGGGGSSTPASYTIGGSVSGLTQLSGVVLENNGADSLTVAANGTFTFSSPVTNGAAYAVTVQSNPTGESCQVGSASGMASGRVTGVSVNCTSNFASGTALNVAPISVGPGPADANDQTFNIPTVTVTVCEPGTHTCATIPNVLVDTGSSGLRLISSALAAAGGGVALPPMPDPANGANDIFECMLFADGYSWGGVAEATVTVGGETTKTAIPVQIINSSSTTVPSECVNEITGSSAANTVDDFDANGVLGVGVFNQDCGSGCATQADNGIYYSCPSSGCLQSTLSTTLAVSDQVANPVASFPTDNNGVIVQLAAISSSGAATANGYLVFGIGTETASATEAGNGLNGATVMTADSVGNFITNFSGTNLQYSFIDSGSNGLYFPEPNPSLAKCGTSGAAADFYCPTSTSSLTAMNTGTNGANTSISFQVANLNGIQDTNFAIDDVGGVATPITGFGTNGTSYFDWGLPFFYGRTIYNAIEGMQAAGTQGPYYAY